MIIVGCSFCVDQSAKEKSSTVLRPFLVSTERIFPSLANQPMAAKISVSDNLVSFFNLVRSTHRFRAMRSIQNRHWLQLN